MNPTVGISLSNFDARAEIFYLVRELGMRALLFDHDDLARWQLLIDAAGRECVVCIVDDDREMIVAATALGVHAVAYRPEFSWHLNITDNDDARTGLAYRLKEWKDKHVDYVYQRAAGGSAFRS